MSFGAEEKEAELGGLPGGTANAASGAAVHKDAATYDTFVEPAKPLCPIRGDAVKAHFPPAALPRLRDSCPRKKSLSVGLVAFLD